MNKRDKKQADKKKPQNNPEPDQEKLAEAMAQINSKRTST